MCAGGGARDPRGKERIAQRAILKGAKLRSREGLDRYCAAGGGAFRIGYPTRRLLKVVQLAPGLLLP